MHARWVSAVLLLASCCWAASAGSFDKPVSEKTVDLGLSQYSSGSRARVRCYYFPSFMVKEVDLGEKGASRLAIIPISPSKRPAAPRCARARAAGEMVINPEEWSGYFKGVKGGYVFFDADDGVNGGMGFAVYEAKGAQKIFSDSAIGPLTFADHPSHEVVIKYERLIQAECVIHRAPSECWQQIRKDLALEIDSPPDCRAGYEKSAQELARGRCQAHNTNNAECVEREIALARKQTEDSPSVIAYPAEVILGPHPAIKPLAGDVRCWPAD